MIRNDRMQLNERFVKVFKMLEERGVIIKNDRHGRGVGDVAERVLGNKSYGHIIRAYLDNDKKRVIDYGQARQFCQAYNISEDYMIDGIGSPFDNEANGGNILSLHPMIDGRQGNILFTSQEAFAGAPVGLDSFTREANTFFAIPGIAGGNLVAFPINGNSMEPILSSGDIIVCREISGINEIKDNELYAVRSSGSVWVKYVQAIRSRTGRVTQLKMISANYLEYDPFVEEVNEDTRLYKVMRRISQF